MKKNIFSFLALALVFAGCTKEATEGVVVPSNDEGVRFVVEATVDDPETRMSYMEDGNGFKAEFYGNETMQVYFLDSKDSVSSKVALSIDQTSISVDGRSAKFEAMQVGVPDDAVKVVSFISNPGVTFAAERVSVDLSAQNNMDEANYRHVILGTANVSDIKNETSSALVKIAYSYKTSILRFKLKLGDGMNAKIGTEFKLSSADNAIHNKLELVGGALASTSETGDIVFKTTDVDTSTHVITGYATIWAADALKNAKLTATYGNDTYSVDLNPSKETLEAGKAYTVTRTLTVNPKPVAVMKNDEAGSMNFDYSGGEDVTNDWLSCKDGVVSWTTNTTGTPRKATLTFKNGAFCTVTQAVPADFKGKYFMTSKIFSKNAFVEAASPGSIDVTFGDPLKGETLMDVDGTSYTNNLGVSGLYYTAVMDACMDIDYENGTMRFGAFLDARNNAQAVRNGVEWYGYACFLPGMGTTTATSLWASPWNFVQPELSKDPDRDYTWLWFTVGENFQTLQYSPNSANTLQSLNTSAAGDSKAICAITVAVSKSANVDADNVRQDWDVVYQGNKFENDDGLVFKKK